jgi:hypothetical protein
MFFSFLKIYDADKCKESKGDFKQKAEHIASNAYISICRSKLQLPRRELNLEN